MSDEKLETFKQVTGCKNDEEAKHLLEACHDDIQRAIDLYFSKAHGGTPNGHAQPGPSRRPRPPTRRDGVIVVGDNDEEEMNTTENEVAATAEDGIRAPIRPVQGPIVEQSFQQARQGWQRVAPATSAFDQSRGFQQVAEEQRAEARRRIAHVPRHGGAPPEIVVNGERAAPPAGPRVQPSDRLRNLFKPPTDLSFNEHWDEARAYAEKKGRWLLVNVQKIDEFACQALNRDVWADPTVKDILRSNFVFWQVPHNSPDGARVCGYYSLRQFPSIFIVDPRTGEQVQTLRAPDAVAFLDQLTTFLDQCPTFKARDEALHGDPMKPSTSGGTKRSPRKNGVFPKVTQNGTSSSHKRKYEADEVLVDDDDEMADDSVVVLDHTSPKRPRVVTIDDDSVEDITDIDALCSDGKRLSTVDPEEWKSVVPTADALATEMSLVLRLPDGRRENMRLPDNCPLRAVFLFVAGLGFAACDHLLILNFPKREFSTADADRTLRDVGFARQELIHVERK